MFALANGRIGLRGDLDEGEPFGLPGTYLKNGFYETRPLPYAEAAYGDPEDGQTVVDVTNGKIIRLLVDDEPFDIRYGELLRHERRLDWRRRDPTRIVEWRSPTGSAVAREVDAPGLLHAALGGRDPLRGSSRSRARCAWSCNPSSSPRELAIGHGAALRRERAPGRARRPGAAGPRGGRARR